MGTSSSKPTIDHVTKIFTTSPPSGKLVGVIEVTANKRYVLITKDDGNIVRCYHHDYTDTNAPVLFGTWQQPKSQMAGKKRRKRKTSRLSKNRPI